MTEHKGANIAEKKDSESFVPFYGVSAETHMSLKVSKDGKSREEDADVLRGMYEEDKGARNRGWKVRRRLFGSRETDDNSDSEPVEQ